MRTLRPLDDKTIMASVVKTHRAVIVDEGWRSGSLAAEISARIMEQALYDLDAPVARVCSAEVPIPYPRHLEIAATPQPEAIVSSGQRSDAEMIEFRMPSLGADMEAGTLVEWLKKPGDLLKRGDVIAVVETQKGAIEIEVFNDGVLDEILTKIGEKVPVGHVDRNDQGQRTRHQAPRRARRCRPLLRRQQRRRGPAQGGSGSSAPRSSCRAGADHARRAPSRPGAWH